MNDLFMRLQKAEKLPLQNADVTFWNYINLEPNGPELFNILKNDIAWEQREVMIWGERRLQPRLTAWYGDQGKSYMYSGARFEPHPWTNLLDKLRKQVSQITNTSFNSVLLNLYRDNNDSMGLHSDDERELGAEPEIASLSLGACRTFTFKRKDNDGQAFKIKLNSESLLLMKGSTQKFWKHGISKQSQGCDPRINLTFRTILA